TGCASLDASTTQYVGAPRFEATDASRVRVLRSEPTKPHDKLGEIEVDASINPAPPVEEIETKLRAEAAKLGADAVVVVFDRTVPSAAYVTGPYWGRSVETVSDR